MKQTLFMLAAALLFLAGCGGGDPDEPAQANPPDCKARPELCR
jgi:hypothetical protein